MFFYADLHIHSKYSRATSKSCNLEELALWAQKKGLSVISTGDFTHPAWFNEIKEKLIEDGNGAYRLKPEIEKQIFKTSAPVRFLLTVEISTIYKKGDKTRKVHHVVFVPNIQTASNFREKLGAIGNINSDGRPILGLDSRNLLETVLESGEDSFIIPAHIWTPWFSVLGSKSGFDSIEECYDDLSEHIFAVETGLSSDPEMNWRVSKLDKFRLVSNSDAHSPAKLAREATVFDTAPDYFSIINALKSGEGYVGTVEFFPEEDYVYIRDGLSRLSSFGYLPILAHAERYEQVMEDGRAQELKRRTGCLYQVNAASLTGENGFGYKSRSRKLVKNGLADFIATDAHDERARAPRIERCADWLEKHYGAEERDRLLIHNPAAVLGDRTI